MRVLEMVDVTRRFADGSGAVTALEDVRFGIDRGELVAVMGASGSGKSTLLHLAGGLDQPSSGVVSVNGTDLALLRAKEMAALRRRDIGVVFQEYNLFEGLTAAENVALPLELDNLGRKVARDRARVALDEVGLGDMTERFPADLSGGERQRVAIARGLVGDQSLLLADEPTGALDSMSGELILRLVRRRCDAGGSGLLVTHDAQLAAWADRIVFLRDGRVVDEAGPAAGPDDLLIQNRT